MSVNDNLKAFWEGMVEGAKETPRQFFAPVIAFCMIMSRGIDEVMNNAPSQKKPSVTSGKK